MSENFSWNFFSIQMGQFALAFMLNWCSPPAQSTSTQPCYQPECSPCITECGARRPCRLRPWQPLRPWLCGGGKDTAGQTVQLQPWLLCTGARICTERVEGTSQGEKDYMAGLKSGPQGARMFQASWGRIGKQLQEQTSTNLGPTFSGKGGFHWRIFHH